ncbi:MAG: hypothetical protein BJ554DRAFT_7834 [Olpidium bornovanus]|uniref:Cilia-and flagella-associated protein 96 n=1 Tax=Olpidium bornovanus TaxID=278681 RepID=A0A8H7ZV09_9FUNG|nr:MAG: hypothetical protein BJ554DRAFT_7834 [Olpidium bornovanus]
MSSPYDAAHQLELEEKELHRKRIVNEKPFVSAGREIEFFDANVFKAGKPRTPATPAQPARLPILVPFRPSNPPKSGLGGTINRYPAHEPDPAPSKAHQQKAAEEARRRAAWARVRVFRPAGGPKAYVTRSVALENVDRQMPPPYVKEVLVAARRKECMREGELPARRCNVLNLSG